MNCTKMLKILNKLKSSHKISYETISAYIECAKFTCYCYFNGQIKISIDRLILLAYFFDIDLDKLCGKE